MPSASGLKQAAVPELCFSCRSPLRGQTPHEQYVAHGPFTPAARKRHRSPRRNSIHHLVICGGRAAPLRGGGRAMRSVAKLIEEARGRRATCGTSRIVTGGRKQTMNAER